MSINDLDRRLLDLLVEQGHVTRAQRARLEQQLERGLAFEAAMAATPLVDPLKYATLRGVAARQTRGSESGEAAVALPSREDLMKIPAAESPAPPPAPLPEESFSAMETVPVEFEQALEDGFDLPDDADELEALAEQYADAPHEHAAPAEGELPEGFILPEDEPEAPSAEQELPEGLILSEDELELPSDPRALETLPRTLDVLQDDELMLPTGLGLASPSPMADNAGNLAQEPWDVPAEYQELEPLWDLGPYMMNAIGSQPYDLSTDQGIVLIGEVNRLLVELIAKECAGLVFDQRRVRNNFYVYDASSKLVEVRTLEGDRINKVMNRVKVMARLKTWRQIDVQQGQCVLVGASAKKMACVDVIPQPGDREVMVVRLLRSVG